MNTTREHTGSWCITSLNPAEAPWPLLLLADPSREKVQRYLPGSTCFAARQTEPLPPSGLGAMVGTCVMQPLQGDASSWEMMNLAVAPAWQRRGIGAALVRHAMKALAERGAQQLEVGAGSFGDQLLFLQRLGFRVCGLERDFYLHNYTTPLWERGVQLKDRLRLRIALADN